MGDRPAPPDRDSDDREPDDRDRDAPQSPPVKIQPVKERVGESPDNLRRRQSWFRKRTGEPG
jgi:hypothetical protein